MAKAVAAAWDDAWLLAGVRTPFVDYNGEFGADTTNHTLAAGVRISF